MYATQWLAFDAGYQRYAMIGPDPVTSSSADPAANVFTMGMRLWY